MCGIAGILSPINEAVNKQVLKEMTNAISHRGPDGEGHWINESGNLGFGHRRLSIIDLSPLGSQPMHYMGRYTIVFNGEIYNYLEIKKDLEGYGYKFKSNSDTEVLMALYDKYKENLFQFIDGMFAFSIWDNKENILFCARDRFGEKPFYYNYVEGKSFFFASEMKSLFAGGIKKEVNERMVYNYLEFGQIDNPQNLTETFYKNITKLRPATFLKISTSDYRIIEEKRYWDINPKIQNENISIDEAQEKLRFLFYNSVKRRLRSDVPVGSSLSGGIDSSLIVLAIDEIKESKDHIQKTFSARFPGYIKDEGRFMQMVINQCNADPYYTFPNEENLIEDIEKIFYHQEEPFGSTSIFAQYEVMKLARKENVTVLLDGQGADEILAGYHQYYNFYFKELKNCKPENFNEEWEKYTSLHSGNKINSFQKKGLKEVLFEKANPVFNVLKDAKKFYQRRVKPQFADAFYAEYSNQHTLENPHFTTLNEALYWNVSSVGLEQLLRYSDRNSMAHGREVRLPFLSHELVEFVFSLPSSYKIHDGWTKWILRKTFENLLPNEITWRKDKIGYEPPQKDWMKNPRVIDMIMERRQELVKKGVLNKKVLDYKIIPESANQNSNNTWSHWMVGNLYD